MQNAIFFFLLGVAAAVGAILQFRTGRAHTDRRGEEPLPYWVAVVSLGMGALVFFGLGISYLPR